MRLDEAMDKVIPAQAAGNVVVAATVKATQIDWLWWLTVTLVALQIVYWLHRMGKEWGWWGGKNGD